MVYYFTKTVINEVITIVKIYKIKIKLQSAVASSI